MPGTILLEDLQRFNDDELRDHVTDLFSDLKPPSSDVLTNPLGTRYTPPQPTDTFTAPDTFAPPPPPEPPPAPVTPESPPIFNAPQPGSLAAGFAPTTAGDVVPANRGGRQAFVDSFRPYAEYAATRLGIDPSVVTAMAISESGGGNIPGNSFFGMKGSPYASGSINLPTWELVNGQRVNISDNFATFSDPKTAVDAWIDFLQKHTPGVFGAQSPEQFAQGLKTGGYMTDTASHYAATLRNLGAHEGGTGQPQMTDFAGVVPGAPAPNAPVTTPLVWGGGGTSTAPSSFPLVSTIGQAPSGAPSPSVIDELTQHVNSLIGPGLTAIGDTAQQLGQHVSDITGGAFNVIGNALPDLGARIPTLEPSSPIARQARGEPVNPFEVSRQAAQGLSDIYLPGDVPVAKGALTTLLDPSTYTFGLGGVVPMLGAAAGSTLGGEAVKGAGGDETAQLVGELAGGLIGGGVTGFGERGLPALGRAARSDLVSDFLRSEEGGLRIPGPRPQEPAPTPGSLLERTLQMYEDADRQPPTLDRLGSALAARSEDLRSQVADRFAPINEAAGRARAALGPAFTPDMDAESLIATYAGRGAAARQRVLDDLQPAVTLVGRDLPYLNAFRKFARDAEVADLKGAGVRQASAGVTSAADAQAGIDDIRTLLGPERFARIERADAMVSDALHRLLNDKVDAGLIDRDLADRLIAEHPHYNPTVVLKYLGEGPQGAGGRSLQVTSNLLRRLAEEGSADATEAPIRSATRQLVQGEALIERNRTAQAIVKALQNDPQLQNQIRPLPTTRVTRGPEIAAEGGPTQGHDVASIVTRLYGDVPGTMSVYEGGARRLYSVPPRIEAAVKGLDAESAGLVGRFLKRLNEPLRWGATAASPPFLVTNAAADAITTYIREGAGTAARIPKGWWAAARQSQLYRDYVRAGGGMESLYQRPPRDLDKLVAMNGGLVVRRPGDVGRIAKDALKLEWIRRIGEVVEQGPRLATFERHLARGETPAQAATAGRRVTVDFSRGGESIRQANNLALFLNARLQGMLNIPRTLRDNPASRVRVATLAALAVSTYAWNRQFPEYQDIPNYIKDQYMVVMLPGSEKDPNGPGWKKLNYIAIPLREWATFVAPFTYALGKLDQQDPRGFDQFAASLLRTASPIAGEDPGSMAGGFLPAPLRTAVELGANQRFYSGLPIVGRRYQDLPPSQQFNERTSVLAKTLTDRLGVFSPMQWDFIISENFAGAGRAVTGSTDVLAGKPTEGIPVASGVLSGVLRTQGGQLEQEQWRQHDQLMSQYQEAVSAAVRGSPEYQSSTPDRQHQMLSTAQNALDDTVKERVGIQATPRDLGLGPKYRGITDPAEEQRIDRLRTEYERWVRSGRSYQLPLNPQDVVTAQRYSDPDMLEPRYRVGSTTQQQESERIRNLVQQGAQQ